MRIYTCADLSQTQVSNYNAETGKFSNIQHDDRRSSNICRSFAQLPGQNSYCSITIMVQKELDEKMVCLDFFRKFVISQTAS